MFLPTVQAVRTLIALGIGNCFMSWLPMTCWWYFPSIGWAGNYSEILEEWRRITKELGAAIVVLDMPLLDTRARDCGGSDVTSTLIADIVLQLLSYVAQVERENIHRRQAEGIAAARARGVRFGRPRKPCPPQFERVRDIYEAGNITRSQAAKRLGVCVGTFDRWMRETE